MLKHLYKYSFILLSLGIFVSCSNDNDPENLFGEAPTERLNEQTEELYNLLQSSPEGWKVTYFTDDPRYTNTDQQLGGWTFIFKFTNDQQVTMASDFSAETLTPNESEYEIQLGSTIKLAFVTKNYIHLLSDSNNSPTSALTGKGYLGDFEFLYYGQDGEDLIFRSNRFQIELRFQKATAQDWADLEEARQTGNLLATSEMTLQINSGEGTSDYEIFYNPASRYARVEADSLSFGIAPLADGLKAVKPIPVGDQVAIDFVYDAANDWFISELENGATAKIILDVPDPTVHLFEDFNYFTFQRIEILLGDPTTNGFAEIFVEAMDNSMNAKNMDLFGFFIQPSDNILQYIFFDENGNTVRIYRDITYTIDTPNDRFILTGNGGWTDPSYESLLKPLDDLLLSPDGYKIIDTGKSDGGDPIYGFSLYSDASITYAVLAVQ